MNLRNRYRRGASWLVVLVLGVLPIHADATAKPGSCLTRQLFAKNLVVRGPGVPAKAPGEVTWASADKWNDYLGDLWKTGFEQGAVPKDGVVIEVAPGNQPKIGLGLEKIDFSGTLYVVEPEELALRQITQDYARRFPRAKIVGIQRTLRDAIDKLPKNPDAIVANHPLDDMVIGEYLGDNAADAFHESYTPGSMEAVKKAWGRLIQDPEKLKELKAGVVSDWSRAIEALNPGFVGIAQYPSVAFQAEGFHDANLVALGLLSDLKARWGETPHLLQQKVAIREQEPRGWWFLPRRSRAHPIPAEVATEVPEAVERLGEELFVGMDATLLHPGAVEFGAIAPEYLSGLYGGAVTSSEAMKALDEVSRLSLESAVSKRGKRTRKVWVDRQSDPLRIAMNGNAGSGRAAYVGRKFNSKGIGKTVLAVSDDPTHSNGVLDMANAAWEMLAANSLHHNIRTGTSPVVALVDRKRKVAVSWSLEPKPSATIIRLDDGNLDRPTHVFESGKPVSKDKLLRMATQFGRQDAEKFIERVEHGAWSAGNISQDGVMLDFDTVAAVRGRAPQVTLTAWRSGNYFGLEGRGHLKLLKSLAAHSINTDRIPYTHLERAFLSARAEQLRLRILDLFGIDAFRREATLAAMGPQVDRLTGEFERLSRMMYPNFDGVGAWSQENGRLHVFDFSRFFSLYPLWKRFGSGSSEEALGLLLNPNGVFKRTPGQQISPGVRKMLLKQYAVRDGAHLQSLKAEARRFIEEYDALLSKTSGPMDGQIFPARPGEEGRVVARALVTNEDRRYLDYSFGNRLLERLTDRYSRRQVKRERFNEIVHALTAANDRIAMADARGRYVYHTEVFLNGTTSRILGEDFKFEPQLKFFKSAAGVPGHASARWEVEVAGRRHPASTRYDSGQLVITGPELSDSLLLEPELKVRFFRNGRPFDLGEL